MSFAPYPAYKTTPAEWIGKIPDHWPLIPLKYLVRFTGGGTPDKQNLDYWDGNIPWVSPKDMRVEVIRDTQDKITEAAVESSATHWVSKGAVILVFRSGILCRTIPVALAGTDLCLNQDMKALLGFPDPAYLLRLIQAHTAELLPIWRQQGATVESLEYEQVINTEVPFPPAEERRAIIDFLDHETAKIDALVAEQKRLIELLKEKRQAVISHAVTQGLDPNVPMKDSGVKWLGDVPAHWEVRRIGSLYTEASEKGQKRLPILQVSIHAGVSDRELEAEEYERKTIRIEDKKKYKRVRPGDLTYNMMRAWQGAFGAVQVNGLVSPAYIVARPSEVDTSEFVERQLRSPCAIEEMRRYSYGVADFRMRLYWDAFKNINVAMPDRKERLEILKHIQVQTRTFEQLKREAERSIALLTDRRSALISAAVTGKIDVRNWHAAKETVVAPEPWPMAAEERASYRTSR